MKRLSILLCCCSALVIAGCGGGGGGGGNVTPSFVGSYAGTWNAPSQGTSGNLNVTVAANNTANGTMTGTQYPGTGIVSGSLPPSGQFSGTIEYDANHTYSFQGPASFSTTEAGHLVGTVNQDFVGVTIPINFDLVKQ